MKLREIRHLLGTLPLENSRLQIRSDLDNDVLFNITAFKSVLPVLKLIPPYRESVEKLEEGPLFLTTADNLAVAPRQQHEILKISDYLFDSALALLKMLDGVLVFQKENTVSVRLPDPKNLGEVVRDLSSIDKAVSQIVVHKDIDGTVVVQDWESGSFWLDLFLGTHAALSLVAGAAWSASKIYKKIQEGKILRENVRTLKLKNDTLEEIKEAQKKEGERLLDAQARDLQKRVFGDDKDNDYLQRLKFAIKTLSELMDRGAEIRPALNAPPEIKELLPLNEDLLKVEADLKLLGGGELASEDDELSANGDGESSQSAPSENSSEDDFVQGE